MRRSESVVECSTVGRVLLGRLEWSVGGFPSMVELARPDFRLRSEPFGHSASPTRFLLQLLPGGAMGKEDKVSVGLFLLKSKGNPVRPVDARLSVWAGTGQRRKLLVTSETIHFSHAMETRGWCLELGKRKKVLKLADKDGTLTLFAEVEFLEDRLGVPASSLLLRYHPSIAPSHYEYRL